MLINYFIFLRHFIALDLQYICGLPGNRGQHRDGFWFLNRVREAAAAVVLFVWLKWKNESTENFNSSPGQWTLSYSLHKLTHLDSFDFVCSRTNGHYTYFPLSSPIKIVDPKWNSDSHDARRGGGADLCSAAEPSQRDAGLIRAGPM